MEEQKKAAVPTASALHTELPSSHGPLAKELRYTGADAEQPLCNNNKAIITDLESQHNLQTAKNDGLQADNDKKAENVGNEKIISGISGRLDTVSMTELYDTIYPPKIPIIEGLLHAGTYLFVGAPKVGKSFFMAQLGYHISMGIPLWEYPVRKGTVLYLALEDDHARLQRRLSRMFGMESSENFHFATKSRCLNEGLVEQIGEFVKEHADTKLVIIDTLQKVRETESDRFSYASDYEIVTRLKEFSDSKEICLLVVHHTRKMESSDSFDMISGTNGLLGAADGAFVMHKEKRTDNRAVLEMAGRDQQDQRLLLEFDRECCLWNLKKVETELWKEPPDPILDAVSKVVTEECPEWSGTASELLQLLPDMEMQPNILTRKLNISMEKLYLDHGIRYETKRGHSSRMIRLTLEKNT